jgi:hypothetical protein
MDNTSVQTTKITMNTAISLAAGSAKMPYNPTGK